MKRNNLNAKKTEKHLGVIVILFLMYLSEVSKTEYI